MYTPTGKFRNFGFIGFRTDKDARVAVNYFNQTYIDTSKIVVDFAKSVGDDAIPRAWSRHTKGTTAYAVEHGLPTEADKRREQFLKEQEQKLKADVERKKKFYEDLYLEESDPKLKEFLEVVKPRSQARTWANDDAAPLPNVYDPKVQVSMSKTRAFKAVSSEVIAVPNRKPGGEGTMVAKTHVKFGDEDEEGYATLAPANGEERKEHEHHDGDDYNDGDDDAEKKQGGKKDEIVFSQKVSDLDYLKSRMASDADLDDLERKLLEGEEDEEDEEEEERDEDDHAANDRAEKIEKKKKDSKSKDADMNSGKGSSSKGRRDLFGDEDEKEDGRFSQGPVDRARSASVERTENLITDDERMRPEDVQATLAETGRLFVRNLAFACTEDDLKRHFSKYGPLSEVHIPISKETKQPKGYAYILYLLPEHAVRAYTALDGKIFQGRLLHILPAKEKPDKKIPDEFEEKSFKSDKEKRLKEQASSDHNWNTLFMNPDTVAEAMAKELGVSKGDILNPAADNMAVRLALAETHIINNTKKYLEREGVSLDAFIGRSKSQRSNTVILVKNIPYTTEVSEIREMFAKFGSLGRVLLPPTKTVAIVEFLETNEAKAAFRHLAYSRFKQSMIYLEWAPVGSFTREYNKDEDAEKSNASSSSSYAAAAAAAAGASANESEEGSNPKSKDVIDSIFERTEGGDGEGEAGTSVFVKNLNFDTNEETLRKTFESIGPLRSVRISMKKDLKNPGKMLSMGFGFVEFVNRQDAVKAISLQGVVVDGHSLLLKFSQKQGLNAGAAGGANASAKSKRRLEDAIVGGGTKLLIRNVPFEAKEKDLRDICKSFGQIKSVRLPRKFDGSHRGFCFVDFLTKQDAKSAFENLSSTHLYGRHLVIEWAKDDDSVEAMREKTGKHFVKDGGSIGNKKRKIVLNEEDEEGGQDNSDMDEDF